jgi:hypothetical protein
MRVLRTWRLRRCGGNRDRSMRDGLGRGVDECWGCEDMPKGVKKLMVDYLEMGD